MPDDRRRPPRPPGPPDDDLREALELLATVAASVSDRVEGQSTALDRMAKVLAETRTAAFAARKHTDPARTADQVAAQVEHRLSETLRALSRTTNLLAQETDKNRRLLDEDRALGRDATRLKLREAEHAARWRRRLLLWTVPAVLVLILFAALLAPRLLAASDALCTLAGASWLEGAYGRSCAFYALW